MQHDGGVNWRGWDGSLSLMERADKTGFYVRLSTRQLLYKSIFCQLLKNAVDITEMELHADAPEDINVLIEMAQDYMFDIITMLYIKHLE